MDIENYEQIIDSKNEALGRGIANVIKKALNQRRWTVQYLAAQTGVARQTLSLLIATTEGRSWTLNHLVRVTDALGISLTDLISAAEFGTPLPVSLDLAGTEPHSKERLTRIIQTIASKGTSKEVLSVYLTADMMAISVPDYVKAYLDGKIEDRSVYELLWRINDNLGPDDNLWVKLSAFMSDSKATVITKTEDK